MYIKVYNENHDPLEIVKESEFGDWLVRKKMGIVSFISREDICTAIVGHDE